MYATGHIEWPYKNPQLVIIRECVFLEKLDKEERINYHLKVALFGRVNSSQ